VEEFAAVFSERSGGGRGVIGVEGSRWRSGCRGGGREEEEVIQHRPRTHRHPGVFIAKAKITCWYKEPRTGESVYGEKRYLSRVDGGTKVEYRVWNPFRSKLAAGVLGVLMISISNWQESAVPRCCQWY